MSDKYRLYVKNNTLDEDVFYDANDYWLKNLRIAGATEHTEYDYKIFSVEKMPMIKVTKRGNLIEGGVFVENENGNTILTTMSEPNIHRLKDHITGDIQDVKFNTKSGVYEVRFTRTFYFFDLELKTLQYLINESSSNYLRIIQEGCYTKSYSDGYKLYNAVYLEIGMV